MTAALANHVLQSTVFAVAAAVLALCLRHAAAKLRYSVWLAASVKFLVPFSILVEVGRRVNWSPGAIVFPGQAGLAVAMAQISEPFTAPESHFIAPVAAASAHSMIAILLPLVWIAGCVMVLILHLSQWRRAAGALRTGTLLRAGREVGILRRLDPIAELISCSSQMEPGVLGIVRPVLTIPRGIGDHLDDDQLGVMFSHELCHIRRRDNFTAALHVLVETVFWFHPLVWWIGGKLVEERERACDEEVLRSGGDAELYAATILEICKFYVASPLVAMAGIGGSNLGKRIENIMKGRPSVRSSFLQKLVAASAGVLALVAPIVIGVSGGVARAQTQLPAANLKFEAASVKVNPSGGRDMSWGCRGTDGKTLSEVVNHAFRLVASGDVPLGRCVVRNAPMNFIVSFAYEIPWDQMNQMISGGPEWFSAGIASSERFDIDAEAGKSATRAQLYEMLRSLLAERFGLRLHPEDKAIPVYELTAAKGGAKLVSAPRDRDCSVVGAEEVPCHNFSGGFGGLTGRSVTMDDFAARLSRYTGLMVVDKTGLDGLFDIRTGGFYMPFPDVPEDRQTAPRLADMLESQLGLSLKAGKDPVRVLVVDQVAKEPSAN